MPYFPPASSSDATKLPLAGGTMTGNLLFSADGARSIGAAGATRPFIHAYGFLIGSATIAAGELKVGSGTGQCRIQASGTVTLGSATPIIWSGGDPSGVAADLGLYRNAAGVLEVNNGTAGTFRDLRLRTLLAEASTTTQASIRIAHGSAPTTPVNGDMWSTTAGLFIYINGVTKTVTLT